MGVPVGVPNMVAPSAPPKRKRRASRSDPDRQGVPKSQADCSKKIRKFVNLDNATVRTVLEYEKDGAIKKVVVWNLVPGVNCSMDIVEDEYYLRQVCPAAEAQACYSIREEPAATVPWVRA